MKNALLLFAAAMIGIVPLGARQLSPAQALDNVMNSIANNPRKVITTSRANVDPQPVYTARDASAGLNTVYVFNRDANGGYLVVSADDVALPLLGYADSGTIDPANMPPAMVAWLQSYSDEIARLAASPAAPGVKYMTRSADRAPIAPMTKTLWNQDAPYNNMCPTVSGTRCVTGCVATATAQVMKFHNWPPKGVGTHSYSWNNSTLSLDFSTITFDWDNMLDSYTSSATTQQNNAVAQLMYAASVSADMNYGTSESGTSIYYAGRGLVDNLNYDKGLSVVEREFYPLETWKDMVYNELAAGRVVEYGGQSSAGGHCFVCDGYSSDGYFHFNWGWGGMSNGYYLLTALDPTSQGIGGSGAGFNEGQNIILGCQPPVAGNTLAVTVITQANFGTSQGAYTPYTQVTFTATGGAQNAFFNMSLGTLDITFGAKITAEDGSVTYASATSSHSLEMMQGIGSYNVPASEFPTTAGTYTVTPAVCVDGKWSDVLVKLGYVRSLKLTVTPNSLNFTSIAVDVQLAASDLQISSPLYSDADCQIKATLSNSGSEEFYGEVIPVLMTISGTTAQLVAEGTAQTLDIMPGETSPMEAIVKFSNVSAGTYYFGLITADGRILGNPIEVTVEATPTGSSSIYATNPTATTGGKGTSAEPATVDGNNAEFNYTVTVSSGYLSGSVGAYIFYDSNTVVRSFGQQFVSLSAGQSANINMKGSLTDLDEKHTYVIVPWNFSSTSSGQIGNPTYFTVSYPGTGIADETEVNDFAIFPATVTSTATVTAPDAIHAVTYYTLAGIEAMRIPAAGDARSLQVDASSLAPGFYLVAIETPSASKTIQIIKK